MRRSRLPGSNGPRNARQIPEDGGNAVGLGGVVRLRAGSVLRMVRVTVIGIPATALLLRMINHPALGDPDVEAADRQLEESVLGKRTHLSDKASASGH